MAAQTPTALATPRVDQVGSLMRPEPLRAVRARYDAGQATADELRQAEDDAIRAVVARQDAIGFPVLTDGEFRRDNFQDSFAASVAGFAGDGPAVYNRQPVAERLRLVRNQPLDEFRFAQPLTTRPIKVTLIGPDRITQRFEWEHPQSRAVYPDVQQFVDDVVAVERDIVRGLVDAGCQYVQIDAPGYTAYLDPVTREPMQARGEDPDQNVVRSIHADNAVIAGFPGVTFGIHLCRGGRPGAHRRRGGYDAIAERLFNVLQHDRFLLEYDTDRAGTFEPLRFVPKGKLVVLGLVSSKVPTLESEDALKRRIEEASRYLSLDQLALSPQCGFSGGFQESGERVGEDMQWRKLELIQRVAAAVWP
jgi:5-methyltetrahydropteroyltriglutamate--homocysteine methyltransferase